MNSTILIDPQLHRCLARDSQIEGSAHFAALLRYWMKRCDTGLRKFQAILNWAMSEQSALAISNLSRFKAGQVMPGLKALDAIAEANQLIWCWHVMGADAALFQYGPFDKWGVRQEWMARAVWLPNPDAEAQPLHLGDMAMLAAGRLRIPYLDQEEQLKQLQATA